MNRMFVSVECSCYTDGSVRPLRIIYPDGRTWSITRTLHISTPADNEFEGIRYTVLIGSAERYIYRLGSAWYVEPTNVEVDTS